MLTEAEIKAQYKALHDELTARYYTAKSGLSQEEFDTQHGQIWKDMTAALIAGGYLPSSDPQDQIEARLVELMTKPHSMLSMLEVQEFLYLLAKRSGINPPE